MLKVKSGGLNDIKNKLKEGFFIGLFNNEVRIKFDLNKGGLVIVNKKDELLNDNECFINELIKGGFYEKN